MNLAQDWAADPDGDGQLFNEDPSEAAAHAQPQIAAPLARGTAKARKAHKGFEKLLSAAGVWEVAKASIGVDLCMGTHQRCQRQRIFVSQTFWHPSISILCFQGKGRAVLVPPQWIWEGFAQFAPDAAEVACTALDMLSAARYFEVCHRVVMLCTCP